jgi:lysophospholipase L1-like esterase
MLNEQGTPGEELFIEDGLHMSKAGYDIWAGEIIKFMK